MLASLYCSSRYSRNLRGWTKSWEASCSFTVITLNPINFNRRTRIVWEPIRCSPDLWRWKLIFGYNEGLRYLLPIIVFRCQNEYCRIGAVVGLESEPIETGSMGRVDHEVDDEEGVEGEWGENNQSAQPGNVSTHYISQWFQKFSRQSNRSHILQKCICHCQLWRKCVNSPAGLVCNLCPLVEKALCSPCTKRCFKDLLKSFGAKIE